MITFEDSWFTANDDNNGVPVVLQGRNSLNHLIGLSSHSTLIRFVWKFEPAGAHGLPAEAETERMERFEKAVMEALEAERVCIFYCIYQHEGVKEWLAYCSSVDAAEEILNVALMDHEEYPIELSEEEDPEWSDYKSMMEGTGHSIT